MDNVNPNPINTMSENEKPQYDPFAVPEGYDPNATEQPQQTLPPEEPWYKRNPAMMNFVALTIAIIASGLFVYLPHKLNRLATTLNLSRLPRSIWLEKRLCSTFGDRGADLVGRNCLTCSP